MQTGGLEIDGALFRGRTIVPGPAGSTVKLGFQSEYGQRMEAPLKRTTGKVGIDGEGAVREVSTILILCELSTPARGSRAANPVFGRPDMVSETPSIALGDEVRLCP